MAERIDYLTEKDTRMVGDHLYRYWLADMEIGEFDFVFDVACGFGYGTQLLDRIRTRNIIGIDKLSEKELKYIPFYKYSQKDLNNIKFILTFKSVLVSFETLEHLENPQNIIQQFPKFNKVILSVPIIPTKHINKAHLQDFTEAEVLAWFPTDVWKIKWTKKQNDIYLILCAEKI